MLEACHRYGSLRRSTQELPAGRGSISRPLPRTGTADNASRQPSSVLLSSVVTVPKFSFTVGFWGGERNCVFFSFRFRYHRNTTSDYVCVCVCVFARHVQVSLCRYSSGCTLTRLSACLPMHWKTWQKTHASRYVTAIHLCLCFHRLYKDESRCVSFFLSVFSGSQPYLACGISTPERRSWPVNVGTRCRSEYYGTITNSYLGHNVDTLQPVEAQNTCPRTCRTCEMYCHHVCRRTVVTTVRWQCLERTFRWNWRTSATFW